MKKENTNKTKKTEIIEETEVKKQNEKSENANQNETEKSKNKKQSKRRKKAKEKEELKQKGEIKKISKTRRILVKTKEIINRFFNSPIFPVVICIFLFLKTIMFYLSTISLRETIDKDTILGTAAFLITLFCIISALPNRLRTIITILVDIFLSFLLFADNIYYTYASSVLSIAQITNIQYGEEILNTVPNLIRKREILYFVDIIFILFLLCVRVLKIYKKGKTNWKMKAAKIAMAVIAIVLFLKIDVDFIEKADGDPFNKDMQVKKSTIYGYHISDIEKTINIKRQAQYADKEEMLEDYYELKEDYEEEYGETDYDLQGVAKGKNVIILQLESIQNFVINETINGQEITPNLNKFINENIEISNMFMQSYSSTADSEFSAITSLYPMENGMSYSRYYTNEYDNLFTMFENEGYTTSYMHGNVGFFWNRESVYEEFGVENIELVYSFPEQTEYIEGYLSDELLYTQAIDKLKSYEEPFVSYIVSASSHTPFDLEGLIDRNKVSVDVGEYKDTFFGNYLEAVSYADYAFGVFIDELKEAGLYDDTVILIFGDHNGMDMYNEEMLDFLREKNPNLTDVDIKLNYIRVAAAIKIPGFKSIEIEKPVSKLDVKPTLAYLIDGDAGFSLGTNMFASKDFICLNNERIVAEEYYFDERWYRIKDGSEIILEELPQDERELLEKYYENMRKELAISVSISINNLLE